jgi:hypothetical protein
MLWVDWAQLSGAVSADGFLTVIDGVTTVHCAPPSATDVALQF